VLGFDVKRGQKKIMYVTHELFYSKFSNARRIYFSNKIERRNGGQTTLLWLRAWFDNLLIGWKVAKLPS
jgi:hypothetical protein